MTSMYLAMTCPRLNQGKFSSQYQPSFQCTLLELVPCLFHPFVQPFYSPGKEALFQCARSNQAPLDPARKRSNDAPVGQLGGFRSGCGVKSAVAI